MLKCTSATFVSIIISGFAGAEDKDWFKFAPEGKQFEIYLPGKLEDLKQDDCFGILHRMRQNGGPALIAVEAFPLLKQINLKNADAVGLRFDDYVKQALKPHKEAKLVSKEVFVFGGKYPALVLEYEIPDLGVFQTRTVLTERTEYRVTFAGSKDYLGTAEVKRVWDSFKLRN